MAEKILSQDEVEALLQGVTSGEVETEGEGTQEGANNYDLTNQERIIRGRMPSLEIINERFARLFQISMTTFLKKEIEVIPVSIDMPKFGELMRKIPLPSSINIVKMDPLRGAVLIILDTKFVYRLVDLYFGGSGQTYVKIEGRDFTSIESRIIQKVVDKILSDLETSWKP
ncbi:MAG: flagellar motor switch protein FliM, partial [Nitrospirota bacterium]|nr:flagellar motor switch protein FliM [Nitrospirota bacterium]